MRFLIWLIILAALAVGVTFIADLNTGYALFIVPPYRIELSLNLLIIVLIAVVVVLYLLLKFIVGMLALPVRVRRWRELRKQNESRRQGYLAMIALVEGRMQRVERAAEKALVHEKSAEARAVVALAGAKAAHVRRDFAQRDLYLQKIDTQNKVVGLAASMLKTELLFDERRYSEALSVITDVRKASPKLISAMRLELRLQQQEGNALRMIELADKLEKLDVFDHMLAERIRHEAYLLHVRKIISLHELKEWWNKLPQSAKRNAQIALAAVKSFVLHGDKSTAAKIIEDTLDKAWDSELLDYYGRLELKGSELTQQLQKTESWLQEHSHDAELLLTLGRLCAASELWGKAQSYFEASLGISENAVTHAELGRLLDRLEHNDQANQHYRRSLELTIKL